METGRSKELREYLQKTLKLLSALPEPEEDPEFYKELYNRLKPHHEELQEALRSAYSNEEDLQLLIEEKLKEDFGEIPNAKSDANGIRKTIKWMVSKGYLLEFIAAAHSNNNRNPELGVFVRKTLLTVVEPLIASQQVSQSELELPPLISPPLAKGSNGSANNHDTGKSNGKTARRKKARETTQSPPEAGQDHVQAPLTPFPYLISSKDKQSSEDPIALARGRTRIAQEKMQLVYKEFEKGEKLSQTWIVDMIRDAKKAIDGISDIFYYTPIPNYPELDYMFANQEVYICRKITIIIARSFHGDPLYNFQNMDEEFKSIFTGLQDLEDLIAKYRQQIYQSNHVREPLLGNGS